MWLFLFLLLLLKGYAEGKTFVVSQDGSGTKCSVQEPCSLQEALNQASNNGEVDDILIMPGTIRAGTAFFILDSDGIRLQPASQGEVILEGGGADSSVQTQIFSYQGGGSVTIRNITFRKGKIPTDDGGAVKITSSGTGIKKVVIEGCQFLSNSAGRGGAVFINAPSAEVSIQDSTFQNNSSSNSGGAIYLRAKKVVLQRNSFEGNSTSDKTQGKGGAVNLSASQEADIYRNKFVGNTAGDGGGIYGSEGSRVSVINNIFTGNSSGSRGGGIYWSVSNGNLGIINNTLYSNGGDQSAKTKKGGGIYLSLGGGSAKAYIYNNILWSNSASEGGSDGDDLFVSSTAGGSVSIYGNVHGASPEDVVVSGVAPDRGSNKTADPAFKDPPQDLDLKPTSSAIDAGRSLPSASGFNAPEEDYAGTQRNIDGDGNGVAEKDAGAYEFGFVVSVKKSGNGFATVESKQVPIYCGTNCSAKVSKGISVTLEVKLDSSSEFRGWGGDCSFCGTSSACTLGSIDSDKTCEVNLYYKGGGTLERPSGCGARSEGGCGGREERAQGSYRAVADGFLLLVIPLFIGIRNALRTSLRKKA